MNPADRMVMGDGAAMADHGVGGRLLDRHPLFELGAKSAWRDEREVWRGPIGIDVCEAATDEARPASIFHRLANLSNDAAARLALELLHPRLGGVVLAHLSGECNRPELAEAVVGRALREAGYKGSLQVAAQESPTGPLELAKLTRQLDPDRLSLI